MKVDGDDKEYAEFREKIDEKIFDLPRIELPLRWIFLRSALAVHEKTSLHISVEKIEELGHELGMTQTEEVVDFLQHFTACGSLLYTEKVPSLSENVIINIQGFTKCLEALFQSGGQVQPTEGESNQLHLEECGILSLKAAEKKIGGVAEFVLTTLVDIGMAAKVPSKQLKCQKPGGETSERYYYLPSARAVSIKMRKKLCSAYIITSKRDLPVDSQARLAKAILEEIPQLQLVPSKYYNKTLFEYPKNGDNVPRLTITFHGETTELRVNMDGVDEVKYMPPVDICKKVLEVCLQYLGGQGSRYNIGLRCLRDQGVEVYHYLFPRAGKTGEDKESLVTSEDLDDGAEKKHAECLLPSKKICPKRKSWIIAAEKVQCLHTL